MKSTARLLWKLACLPQHNSDSLRYGTTYEPQKAQHTFFQGRRCVTTLWTSKNAYDSSEPAYCANAHTHRQGALAVDPSCPPLMKSVA